MDAQQDPRHHHSEEESVIWCVPVCGSFDVLDRWCVRVRVCVRVYRRRLLVELSALPTRDSFIAVDVRVWPENMAVQR